MPRSLSFALIGLVRSSVALALLAQLLPLAATAPAQPQPDPSAAPAEVIHRVYTRLLDPREHPDYTRRAVKPPSWDTFKNRTQFTCLRGFGVKDGRITGYAEEIEKFTRTFALGDVIWPSYPILFASNLGELADEIRRRDLYLFDVWGYVPGSGPGGYWQQFTPPGEAFAVLERKLGERWLGTDIGEQDGRYVGGYASQMTPGSAGRFEQYLNFQRHFEKMGDDLGHKHATLVSLNFGHYLLKEGTFTLIGAETAQALPNNQVYYAFIRGAGKQYGVPWFGNASIYNRWGYKSYGSSGGSGGDTHGPTKGTSLSLMKRLLYSHILYNSVAVGFENGWFEGDKLSPIGRIQQAAQRWLKDHGQPGVMHTPVALLLDFNCGWTFPRHLYSDKVYRVWGNLPYQAGDYLTDAVLDLLYPGYQDSSYYHDESGFITPTPYGDIADCLLSDAPDWLLARYPLIVVAGELQPGREIADKLNGYVKAGGHLVISEGPLASLAFAGLRPAKSQPTSLHGKGKLTVLAPAPGIELQTPSATIRSQVDRPLPKPYRLRPEFRQALDTLFREQQLFTASSTQLSLITCRKGPGEYTLGVANNSWGELPLEIGSHCGAIQSMEELSLDQSEKGATGCLPEGVRDRRGQSTPQRIAGGDVRIFALKLKEAGVQEIPHRSPPPRPQGRVLPIRNASSLKRQILARPTFFQHYDGVILDWTYLEEREPAALQREADWLRRQGLRLCVDASSGINLYPNLRLTDNAPADYAATMTAFTNLFAKMKIFGAGDLLLSLHRHPENNFSGEQTAAGFEKTLRALAGEGAARGVTLHLRMAAGKPPWNLGEAARLLEKVGAVNLRIAPSTALLLNSPGTTDLVKALAGKIGLWLIAAPQLDISGNLWDAHAPIATATGTGAIRAWLALSPTAPLVLDAVYADQDAEYADAVALERLVAQPAVRQN